MGVAGSPLDWRLSNLIYTPRPSGPSSKRLIASDSPSVTVLSLIVLCTVYIVPMASFTPQLAAFRVPSIDNEPMVRALILLQPKSAPRAHRSPLGHSGATLPARQSARASWKLSRRWRRNFRSRSPALSMASPCVPSFLLHFSVQILMAPRAGQDRKARKATDAPRPREPSLHIPRG